jgi:hypothetical protein
MHHPCHAVPASEVKLGYTDVSSLVGWLLFAYVCYIFDMNATGYIRLDPL